MTAAGDEVAAWSYTQIGVTEDPPHSNNVPYDDAWGFHAAWCATFVSYGYEATGHKLPAIDGAPGFSYCPSGQIHGYGYGEAPVSPERGDCLIFSWEPWHMEGGIAICSSGVYAGAAAGDHTGYFIEWLGSGYMRTVEGNTSSTSWDNGGEVRERTDRYDGQICCYWRPSSIAGGGGGTTTPDEDEDEDMYKTCLVVTPGRWNGSVFMCAGGRAVGISDPNIVGNLQARGLAGPTIEVEEWDIYGGYQVVYPSGPGAMG